MTRYTKSAQYDQEWIEENWMGPHPLWLVEELCNNLDLRPGMKVLDMGCGKGLTSVFLAKEYGVTVFANDLWISATDNLRRFEEAGVADRVFPIHAEAHALPYADGFFDAAISMDSYHYYGTDEMYFPGTFAKLVKPGGQLGIVCPGLAREWESGVPDNLRPFWDNELYTFHSAVWWRYLWEKTGLADINACYNFPDTKAAWRPWAVWAREHLDFDDDELLDADVNNELALVIMAAIKKEDKQ